MCRPFGLHPYTVHSVTRGAPPSSIGSELITEREGRLANPALSTAINGDPENNHAHTQAAGSHPHDTRTTQPTGGSGLSYEQPSVATLDSQTAHAPAGQRVMR